MKTMNRILKPGAENGQTMILGIIAALILLVGIFFLFDIHSIIRVKIKAQTAADAAALTAANWQRHSLNIIGELNLVKACTVIYTFNFTGDSDTAPDTDYATKNQIITEMQARMSFVGPMLGFGAAQQAAKNNGMNPVGHYNTIVSQHIENLGDDNFYGKVRQIIPDQGYHWRNMDEGSIPYRDMVSSVLLGQGGIAAAPNVDFASLPQFDKEWLMDLGLYDAIASKYWCYPNLRSHIRGAFLSGWWVVDIVENTAGFPEECEYSPIYINYSDKGKIDFADELPPERARLEALLDNSIRTEAEERGLEPADEKDRADATNPDGINNPLPVMQWCVYEDRWDNGPNDHWTQPSTPDRNLYLRSTLKKEYQYGGAVAKMTCRADPGMLSSKYFDYAKFDDAAKGRKAWSVSKEPLKDPWLSRSPNLSEDKAVTTPVTCSALAKPLGSLAGENTPNSVKMVLPVFTESRLIPVAMQNPTGLYDPFNEDQYNLFEFLKWAADVNDIGKIGDVIDGCPNTYYLLCLQKLNDSAWRQEGIDWLDTPIYVLDKFGNKVLDESGLPIPNGIQENTCTKHDGPGGSNPDGPEILH